MSTVCLCKSIRMMMVITFSFCNSEIVRCYTNQCFSIYKRTYFFIFDIYSFTRFNDLG